MNYVHKLAPPFLLATGGRDFPHLINQSQAFESRLQKAGVRVSSIVLDDSDHLGASYASGEIEGEWPRCATQFMRGVARTDNQKKEEQ